MAEKMTFEELQEFYKKSSICFEQLGDWWLKNVWNLIDKNGHTKMDSLLNKIDTLSYAIGLFQFDQYVYQLFEYIPYNSYDFDSELFLAHMSINELFHYTDYIIDDEFDNLYEDELIIGFIEEELSDVENMLLPDRCELEPIEDGFVIHDHYKDVLNPFMKNTIKSFIIKLILDHNNIYSVARTLDDEWGIAKTAISLLSHDGFYEFSNDDFDTSIQFHFDRDLDQLVKMFLNGLKEKDLYEEGIADHFYQEGMSHFLNWFRQAY